MLYYIAHKNGGIAENRQSAERITHDLQIADLDNTYICPLMLFSHLRYSEIGYDAEMELCIDILSICDALIIASEISKGVQRELDFARTVGMEVFKIENGELRPLADGLGTPD